MFIKSLFVQLEEYAELFRKELEEHGAVTKEDYCDAGWFTPFTYFGINFIGAGTSRYQSLDQPGGNRIALSKKGIYIRIIRKEGGEYEGKFKDFPEALAALRMNIKHQ